MPVSKIRHVVVLMLENRSFDHMLGQWLAAQGTSPRRTDNFNPLAPAQPVSVASSRDPRLTEDPSHHHHEVMDQLLFDSATMAARQPTLSGCYAPTNDGFVRSYQNIVGPGGRYREVMNQLLPSAIPVLTTLAREYAVFTRWFSSVPGQTWPNRCFAHAGTSEGNVDINHTAALWNFTARTIFEDLADADKDWKVYRCGRIPHVMTYRRLRHAPHRYRICPYLDDGGRTDSFLGDIRSGRLPAYSFIEPDHFQRDWTGARKGSNSQHPGHNCLDSEDFAAGEELIRLTYKALTADPDIWHHTAFLITYDEHGGLFDSEPPPSGPMYRNGDRYRYPRLGNRPTGYPGGGYFHFDLLGPRVPAVLVSPYTAHGTVIDDIFDHNCIPENLRRHFGLPGTHGNPRSINASSFLTEQTLPLRDPRDPIKLLDPPIPLHDDVLVEGEPIRLTDFQEALFTMARGIYEEEENEQVRLMEDPERPESAAAKLRWLDEEFAPWWESLSAPELGAR